MNRNIKFVVIKSLITNKTFENCVCSNVVHTFQSCLFDDNCISRETSLVLDGSTVAHGL
jgi:hypothetical protein